MRVVVVDPSRLVLKSVTAMLAARDHHVRAFVDGREALEYIKANSDVDVLMTSTQPLSLCGVELCWETRLLAGRDRPLHIILMSSNCDQAHLVEALDSGADDFIAKPVAPEALYARLRSAERLLSMQRDLIRLATTDPLTGVLNRRAFFECGKKACEQAAAGGTLSAIILDVDHFKQINDQHGHDAGDEALRAIAHEIARSGRPVGRLGGEEFAVMLEGADLPAAIAIAEGLRANVSALRPQAIGAAVTCSFGVSRWEKGDSFDALLKRADLALYEAKRDGRNRVVGADPSRSQNEPVGHRSVVRAVPRAATKHAAS